MEKILGKDYRTYWMGVAILWIMVFHVVRRVNTFEPLPSLFSKGFLGVDIFFFFSSFGLCYSLQKGIRSYYEKRIERLYPLYIIYTLFVLVCFGQYYDDPFMKLFIYQITGLATFHNVDIEWYIPSLIVLYCIFPLLYKIVEVCYKSSILFVYTFIILLVFLLPYYHALFFPHFPARFPIILIGVFSYLALKEKNYKRCFCLYVFCSFMAFSFLSSPVQIGSLMLPLLLWGLNDVINVRKLPFNKIVSFCGKHSLEIYLAQNFAFNHFLMCYDINISTHKKLLLSIIIIIIISTLLFYIQKYFWIIVNLINTNVKKFVS